MPPGNAANNDSAATGDYIYTTQVESTPPIPVVVGVGLEIIGDMALSTLDAVAGVSYTLKVTNTGNMMDTITLEASAEVGIEGSVLAALNDSDRSIELEAGAAKEIALKVAGRLLHKTRRLSDSCNSNFQDRWHEDRPSHNDNNDRSAAGTRAP